MLLVEDELLVRMVIEAALQELDYEVVTAPDGHAALSLLNEGGCDYRVLVTDVGLGAGPSGWDVARRAREIRPDMAVIYMSGAALHEYSAQAVPNSTALEKPFGLGRILAAVSDLTAVSSSSSES